MYIGPDSVESVILLLSSHVIVALLTYIVARKP